MLARPPCACCFVRCGVVPTLPAARRGAARQRVRPSGHYFQRASANHGWFGICANTCRRSKSARREARSCSGGPARLQAPSRSWNRTTLSTATSRCAMSWSRAAACASSAALGSPQKSKTTTASCKPPALQSRYPCDVSCRHSMCPRSLPLLRTPRPPRTTASSDRVPHVDLKICTVSIVAAGQRCVEHFVHTWPAGASISMRQRGGGVRVFRAVCSAANA